MLKMIENRYEFFLIGLLFILCIAPNNNEFNILKIVYLSIGICFICINKKIKLNCFINIFLIYIIILLFNFLQNYFEIQFFLKEISRISMYILLIVVSENMEVKFKNLEKFSKVFIFFNLFIQVIQFFKIGNINKYIGMIYGNTIHLRLTNYETLNLFRSGSIYLNPNIYLKLALIFLVIILQSNLLKINKNSFWILLCLISILFTGSRTGIITLVIIIIFYLFEKKRMKIKNRVITILSLVVFSPFFLWICNLQKNIRLVSFKNDFSQGSMSIKIKKFYMYMSEINLKELLMGKITNYHFDFEFGYLIGWYGVIGLILFFIILNKIYKKSKKEKNYKFTYISIVIILFLNALTAGLYFNILLFPIYLTILSVKKELRNG